jgi:hypothetical protein
MMSLKDQMLLDLDVFFNLEEFACEAAYRPAAGGTSQVTAVFDPDQKAGRGADQAWIHVKKSEVPAPSYRDTFVVDGREWKILQEPGQGSVVVPEGGAWRIRVTAREGFSR